MDWEKAKKRGDEKTPEGQVFSAIRRMEEIRLAHTAFDTEADVWLLETGSDHVLGVGRYYQGEQILMLFNFGDGDETVRLGDEKRYTDLMDGTEGDAVSVPVPAGGFRWLAHTF